MIRAPSWGLTAGLGWALDWAPPWGVPGGELDDHWPGLPRSWRLVMRSLAPALCLLWPSPSASFWDTTQTKEKQAALTPSGGDLTDRQPALWGRRSGAVDGRELST